MLNIPARLPPIFVLTLEPHVHLYEHGQDWVLWQRPVGDVVFIAAAAAGAVHDGRALVGP